MADKLTIDGAERIATERMMQRTREGYDAAHDDEHGGGGELAWAAVAYAAPEPIYRMREYATGIDFKDPFPWADRYDKRKFDHQGMRGNYPRYEIPRSRDWRIAQLTRAGALIAAEIDRELRLQGFDMP